MAKQPPNNTVVITITIIVEKNIRRISELVLRIANEKAMAPRRPEKKIICWKFKVILLDLSFLLLSAEVTATLPESIEFDKNDDPGTIFLSLE